MPQYAFSGKTVLPIATGGTITHLLSIDYAMKPLFSVLGATHILRGVFILDSQMQRDEEGQLTLDGDIETRLKDSLTELVSFITCWKFSSEYIANCKVYEYLLGGSHGR